MSMVSEAEMLALSAHDGTVASVPPVPQVGAGSGGDGTPGTPTMPEPVRSTAAMS